MIHPSHLTTAEQLAQSQARHNQQQGLRANLWKMPFSITEAGTSPRRTFVVHFTNGTAFDGKKWTKE